MSNLRDGHGPHLPMFHPMMPGFGPVAIAKLNVAPLGRFGLLKERFHPLMERPLIAFEGQNVVPFLLNDLGSNIPLGPHGIQRDNRPFLFPPLFGWAIPVSSEFFSQESSARS
jgi:hypothetical protein